MKTKQKNFFSICAYRNMTEKIIEYLQSSTTYLLLTIASLCLLIVATGCHRTREFYRTQADEDVFNLVAEKTVDPRWSLPGYHIEPDSRSRMFYPFAYDCPPMPEDDPTSNQLMHYVDDKHGYWGWEKNGVSAEVENPDWQSFLPTNEDGTLTLTSDRVVELARLHSPDYQAELEDLYFSALDVSFQRFRFDTQFYGGYETFYTADGRERAGDSSSVLDASTRGIQFQKLGATGTELVVGLANSLVWEFSGPNVHSTNTLLDFSLVQPLLREGGRVQVMENLTQSERGLLANVRQLERFNRSFYLEIIAGRSAGPGPNRSAGFPGLGASGSFNAGGFMGLLQQEQNIRNQESNIAALRSSLSQLEAFFEAGRIDSFQVELTRQSLFRDQSSLLSAKTRFQDGLDRYKMDLGLPPEIDVKLERDTFFEQFNLIDPAFTPVQNQLNSIQVAVGDLVIEMLPDPEQEIDPLNIPKPELEWNDEIATRIDDIRKMLAQVETLLIQVDEDFFPLVTEDMQRLVDLIPKREEELRGVQQRLLEYESTSGEKLSEEAVSTGVLSIPRLKRLPGQLDIVMEDLGTRFTDHRKHLEEMLKEVDQFVDDAPGLTPIERYKRAQTTVFDQIPNKITGLISDVLGLSLVQARARTESITLVPVEIDSNDALDVARENRRDWMNARAALVDSWRDIEIFGQDLQSDLDVVFNGDISNVGNNPAKFRSTNGRLQVGLEWDAPITRLAERNNYREALIDYQRTRRLFYQFRDQISRGLRDTIRTLDLNQINFELRRAAVQVAISQVERTQLRLQEPAKPNQNQSQRFDSSTARDLINALDSLLDAQNDFLGVAVNFEVLRRSLDLDMGTMQLDERGIWMDPGSIDKSYWQPEEPIDQQPEQLLEELEKPEPVADEVLLFPPEGQ